MDSNAQFHGTGSGKLEKLSSSQFAQENLKLPLTVLILTKNMEDLIGSCVSSVAWAGQVLLLDNSDDLKTAEKAQSAVPHVEVHKVSWEGYGKTKNQGLQWAQYPWVLWLDGDESLSLPLQGFLKNLFSNVLSPGPQVYSFHRKNYVLGTWVKHGGWYPDRVERLFCKDYVYFSENNVHECLLAKKDHSKNVYFIKYNIEHNTYVTWDQYFEKIKRYAKLSAKDKPKIRSSFWIFFHCHHAFIRSFLFKKGFLDGKLGLILAFGNMFYIWMRHVYSLNGQSSRESEVKNE